MHVPVLRSIILPETFITLLIKYYSILPLNISIISIGDNDHYLVNSVDNKYVLRVYRCDKPWLQKEADYLFEINLLNFFKEHRILMSYPIQKIDGTYISTIEAPEGIRYWGLFSFAEGEKKTLTSKRCYIYGSTISKLHLISNNFKTNYESKNLDQDFLIHKPIKRLSNFFKDNRNNYYQYILNTLKELNIKLKDFIIQTTNDEWGIIGGDFHGFNHFYKSSKEITLFDFDLCGYGWRAYDLAVFKWALFKYNIEKQIHNKFYQFWESFLIGYQTHRILSNNELSMISTFMQLRHIWVMSYYTVCKDKNLDKKYWDKMLSMLHNMKSC